jgi:hypothetical protein
MVLWPICITGNQWGSWKHTFVLRPFHLCIYLNFEWCQLLLVLLEVTLIKNLLWHQITLFLEGWVTPGSPGHRGRVTLQHTEAYRVTRAQVLGHPPKQPYWVDIGQTGAYHQSDQWPPVHNPLVILPFLSLKCVNMILIQVLQHRPGNALLESH